MNEEEIITAEIEQTPIEVSAPAPIAAKPEERRGNARPPRGGNNRQRRAGPRRERVKPEFDQKTLDVRRVARVVAGGRRFSFAVTIVAGDRRGRVGVGTGKAGDTTVAVEKAARNAKKNMIAVKLINGSIAHDVDAKYGSARVNLRPAPKRGLIAGSAVRAVLELCGVSDVSAKILSGSKNKLNNARATVEALRQLP